MVLQLTFVIVSVYTEYEHVYLLPPLLLPLSLNAERTTHTQYRMKNQGREF
jgi:hypothetical protein